MQRSANYQSVSRPKAPGSASARPADPFVAFRFSVELQAAPGPVNRGPIRASFSECTGLSAETQFHEYQEGGLNTFRHRFRGPTQYPPLVLKRGLSESDDLWAWHQLTVQGQVQRRSGAIFLLDAERNPLMHWEIVDALPVRWTGPELRADNATLAFESIELMHRGLVWKRS